MMENNTRNITQIRNDIRRILKTLLSKNAQIEIDQEEDNTAIIARYGNYRSAYIFKNENSSTYQIDLYGIMDSDDEITLFFSSQSSVINFLNNNFFK